MSSHLTAPPLTVDNVIKVVEGVNWRTLFGGLFGQYTMQGGRFIYPHNIQTNHQTDQACLKAVVETYIDDDRRSWRKLIWVLYRSNHIGHAENIRSYAEPLQGGLSWKHKISNRGLIHHLVIVGLSSCILLPEIV